LISQGAANIITFAFRMPLSQTVLHTNYAFYFFFVCLHIGRPFCLQN